MARYGPDPSPMFSKCVHVEADFHLCLDLLYKQNLPSVLPPGYKIIKKIGTLY